MTEENTGVNTFTLSLSDYDKGKIYVEFEHSFGKFIAGGKYNCTLDNLLDLIVLCAREHYHVALRISHVVKMYVKPSVATITRIMDISTVSEYEKSMEIALAVIGTYPTNPETIKLLNDLDLKIPLERLLK